MANRRLTDFAWAAGFIDGEGSLSVYVFRRSEKKKLWSSRREKHYLYHSRYMTVRFTIQATNQDIRPLRKLKLLFGGYIWSGYGSSPLAPNKLYHKWILIGRNRAQPMLEAILPYLVVKQRQAIELLRSIEWQVERGSARRGCHPYSKKEIARFTKVREKICTLNEHT